MKWLIEMFTFNMICRCWHNLESRPSLWWHYVRNFSTILARMSSKISFQRYWNVNENVGKISKLNFTSKRWCKFNSTIKHWGLSVYRSLNFRIYGDMCKRTLKVLWRIFMFCERGNNAGWSLVVKCIFKRHRKRVFDGKCFLHFWNEFHQTWRI